MPIVNQTWRAKPGPTRDVAETWRAIRGWGWLVMKYNENGDCIDLAPKGDGYDFCPFHWVAVAKMKRAAKRLGVAVEHVGHGRPGMPVRRLLP